MSSNPMENVSEEIKKFVLKHHRGYGKEEMMKKFPDVDESKEEYKFETPKFQVEEVVQENPKEARETQEESATLRWTHASEQAGKALRSQGHQCVVM